MNAREKRISNDRRKFMKFAVATAAAGAVAATKPAATQVNNQFKTIKALAFDFYGTVLDVFSAPPPRLCATIPWKRHPARTDLAHETTDIHSHAQFHGTAPRIFACDRRRAGLFRQHSPA